MYLSSWFHSTVLHPNLLYIADFTSQILFWFLFVAPKISCASPGSTFLLLTTSDLLVDVGPPVTACVPCLLITCLYSCTSHLVYRACTVVTVLHFSTLHYCVRVLRILFWVDSSNMEIFDIKWWLQHTSLEF